MIDFEQSFFEDEYRDDFLIVSEMKRAWAEELTVLSEVDRVCRKYRIPYHAEFGTLLGAVRHHGFVPWDDDIDIGLLRPDYIRLMEVLPKELPASYVINSAYTSEQLSQPLGSVTNRDHIASAPDELAASHGCPYICGIDIYPLDYIPRDPALADLQKNLYNVLYDAAQRFEEYQASGELDSYLPSIEELMQTRIDRSGDIRTQLWKLAEQVASMFHAEESDLVTWMPHRILWESEIKNYDKNWYREYTEMPFEAMQVPVPNGYREILTLCYGEDYMTPRNIGAAHGYPFYSVQQEWMEEHCLCGS